MSTPTTPESKSDEGEEGSPRPVQPNSSCGDETPLSSVASSGFMSTGEDDVAPFDLESPGSGGGSGLQLLGARAGRTRSARSVTVTSPDDGDDGLLSNLITELDEAIPQTTISRASSRASRRRSLRSVQSDNYSIGSNYLGEADDVEAFDFDETPQPKHITVEGVAVVEETNSGNYNGVGEEDEGSPGSLTQLLTRRKSLGDEELMETTKQVEEARAKQEELKHVGETTFTSPQDLIAAALGTAREEEKEPTTTTTTTTAAEEEIRIITTTAAADDSSGRDEIAGNGDEVGSPAGLGVPREVLNMTPVSSVGDGEYQDADLLDEEENEVSSPALMMERIRAEAQLRGTELGEDVARMNMAIEWEEESIRWIEVDYSEGFESLILHATLALWRKLASVETEEKQKRSDGEGVRQEEELQRAALLTDFFDTLLITVLPKEESYLRAIMINDENTRFHILSTQFHLEHGVNALLEDEAARQEEILSSEGNAYSDLLRECKNAERMVCLVEAERQGREDLLGAASQESEKLTLEFEGTLFVQLQEMGLRQSLTKEALGILAWWTDCCCQLGAEEIDARSGVVAEEDETATLLWDQERSSSAESRALAQERKVRREMESLEKSEQKSRQKIASSEEGLWKSLGEYYRKHTKIAAGLDALQSEQEPKKRVEMTRPAENKLTLLHFEAHSFAACLRLKRQQLIETSEQYGTWKPSQQAEESEIERRLALQKSIAQELAELDDQDDRGRRRLRNAEKAERRSLLIEYREANATLRRQLPRKDHTKTSAAREAEQTSLKRWEEHTLLSRQAIAESRSKDFWNQVLTDLEAVERKFAREEEERVNLCPTTAVAKPRPTFVTLLGTAQQQRPATVGGGEQRPTSSSSSAHRSRRWEQPHQAYSPAAPSEGRPTTSSSGSHPRKRALLGVQQRDASSTRSRGREKSGNAGSQQPHLHSPPFQSSPPKPFYAPTRPCPMPHSPYGVRLKRLYRRVPEESTAATSSPTTSTRLGHSCKSAAIGGCGGETHTDM